MTTYPTGQQTGSVYELVTAGGYRAVFNDPTDPDYVGGLADDEAITGLDSADVRESAYDKVQSDGGIHGMFFHGRRPITFNGQINASSTSQRNERMSRLQRAVNSMMQEDGQIIWTPDGSIEQFVSVRKHQPTRFRGAGWVKTFFVALVAADPRIYSTTLHTTGDLDDATDHTVENQGNTLTAPEYVKITGPGVNPLIQLGDYQIDVTHTLTGGQYLEIDVGRRSVVDQAGTNRYASVEFLNTTWGGLEPGNNTVRVDFDSGGTSASKIRVDWRDAWM